MNEAHNVGPEPSPRPHRSVSSFLPTLLFETYTAWHQRLMLGFAFYDLDRTVTRWPTWSAFLLFAVWRRSRWRLTLVPLVLAAGAGYRAGLLSRDRLKEIMHALLLGRSTSAPALAALAEAFADRVVAGNIRPGVLARIRHDRADGYRIVLATAAHRFYAEPIARRLGINDVVATAASSRGEALLHRLDGPNLYGAAKLAAVRRWLAATGEPIAERPVRFYTDHVSDLPLLEFAQEPFAINPHGALRRLAIARGWPILDWSADAEHETQARIAIGTEQHECAR